MIDAVIKNVLLASMVSSLLSLFFIISKRTVIRYAGANWHYYLWFTLFMPWLAVCMPWSLFASDQIKVTTVIKALNAQMTVHAANYYLGLSKIIFVTWFTGTIIGLLFIAYHHFQFVLSLKKQARKLHNNEILLLQQLIGKDNHQYLSQIYLSSALQSPMLCHLLQPTIYLPIDFFEQYSNEEQTYVIAHELVHLRRRDLIANISMMFLCLINWFNPILFFAYKHFRIAQELACDAIVIHGFSNKEKKAYAYALLKTVIHSSSSLPILVCGWNGKNQLKERCQMLKFHQNKSRKTLLGVTLMLTMLSTALAAPVIERNDNSRAPISYSANQIQPGLNSHETLLIGNVEITVANNIHIYADKITIKYAENDKARMDAFIINGKGYMQDGCHTIKFMNTNFNPNTAQLFAEQINQTT